MKILSVRKYFVTIFLLVGFVITIWSCTTKTPTVPITGTPIPNQELTNSPITNSLLMTPTSTRNTILDASTPTPGPTMNPSQQELWLQGLEAEYCQLPCYMGIIPGETSEADAIIILEGMGAYFIVGLKKGDLDSKLYILDMKCDNQKFRNSITLEIDSSDIVQSVITTVESGHSAKPSCWWLKYSIKSIFTQLGLPTDILVGLSMHGNDSSVEYAFQFYITYEELGISMRSSGVSEGKNICVGGDDIYSIQLTLINPSNEVDAISGKKPSIDGEYWFTPEDALGMSGLEFYNTILLESPICFYINASRD